MSNDVIRILRYNTGADKYAFLNFKDYFHAVLFNANIVVHSPSAIGDIISVHTKQYIIDPQTHIFQHPIQALQIKNKKNGTVKLKPSIEKYLESMPEELRKLILVQQANVKSSDIVELIDDLVEFVYDFQISFLNNLGKKEYNKYLEFANIKLFPRLLIAPYFMLKKEYSLKECINWLDNNNKSLSKFIIKAQDIPVAAQLVITKDKLQNNTILDNIRKAYNIAGFDYIFIWIDNFSSWFSLKDERKAFLKLLDIFKQINKKPIMAYGGYDSILLCHKESHYKVFGVAQSVGYGESRDIIPVGGGFPANKYYFFPLHQRLLFSEAASILTDQGYFDNSIDLSTRTRKYYNRICNCDQCNEIIKNDINNFRHYPLTYPISKEILDVVDKQK